MTEIIEIKHRSTQGATRPFLCLADNDEMYWVKGIEATRRGLCSEWLAACIAEYIRLPVAPFTIASVPEKLINGSFIDNVKNDLGAGPAFASQHCPNAEELTKVHISRLDQRFKKTLFLFDWIIENEDRWWGDYPDYNGNPNLLLSSKGEPVVIDHNLAFDPEFTTQKHISRHIFKEVFTNWSDSLEFSLLFKGIGTLLKEAIASIPDEWYYLDQEQTVPIAFKVDELADKAAVRATNYKKYFTS